jgi:hypothetical protein
MKQPPYRTDSDSDYFTEEEVKAGKTIATIDLVSPGFSLLLGER